MHLHPEYHAMLAAQRSADLIALADSSHSSSARLRRRRAAWRRLIGGALGRALPGFSLGPAYRASDPREKQAQADTGEQRIPGSLITDGPKATFVCASDDC